EQFLTEFRGRGERPVHALLNTHHHPDHTGGNQILAPIAQQLVAHSRSVENQRRSAQDRNVEADQAYPEITFTDSWPLNIGDESIRAQFDGPAHTGGAVTVFFANANIVHMGDLVNSRGYANIDAPAGGSVHGWIDVL